MSISFLPSAAGLGGTPSGGAYSSGSYQSGFVPNATSTGGIVQGVGSFSASVGSAVQGKLSLGLIELAVLALVGLYIWTHDIQGGG